MVHKHTEETMKLSSLSSMSVALALFVYSCDSTKDSSPTGPDFETLPEAREPDRAAAGEKPLQLKRNWVGSCRTSTTPMK